MEAVELPVKLHAFSQSLQTDRLINIYIGQQETPIRVPESVLKDTSKTFGDAIKHRHLGNDGPDVLRFPDDDFKAWEILLWWRMKGTMPSLDHISLYSEETLLLVQAWILGDKYDIPDFQDSVMLELLSVLEQIDVDLNSVKVAFENTPTGSKLRTVMAESVVSLIHADEIATFDELDVFDGIPGFISEYVRANQRWGLEQGGTVAARLDHKDEWQWCMVGRGPKKHWVHDRADSDLSN